MPLGGLGDALDGHAPLIGPLREERLHSVLVCQPASPPELYTWREALAQRGGVSMDSGTRDRQDSAAFSPTAWPARYP